MTKDEFVERTRYEPSFEEYHHIEESYYDFNGSKDDFCKAWLKDKLDGHWAKELKLRMMIVDIRREYENELSEKEETLEFYRKAYDDKVALKKQLDEANDKLNRIQRIFKRVFDEE